MDSERLTANGAAFAWDGSRDGYLGVLPSKGGADEIRWYRNANRLASHVMNGFGDGRHVHLDTPVGTTSRLPFFPDVTGRPVDPRASWACLSRWTVDTEGGESLEVARQVDAPGGSRAWTTASPRDRPGSACCR